MGKGIVKKSTGSNYEIMTADNAIINAVIKGKFRMDAIYTTNPVAVGDEVGFMMEGEVAIINELFPRRNHIIRKSNNLSHESQIIASNLDAVMIMVSLKEPYTSMGFVDRILLIAEAYQIPAIIVINKTDLYTDAEKGIVNDYHHIYPKTGYPIIEISAKENQNIDEVREFIEGKKVLITGHSGTGKTTLMNLLNPALNLKTSTISSYSNKGTHTTTFAEMHIINPTTFVIDTPGIKDFGIIDIAKEDVGHYFPEIRELLGQCKYNNCLHLGEPGCVVAAAVENGEIAAPRFYSYCSIVNGNDIKLSSY
ncbi:MAG: ribosome small subunit-dependent GTPase A [Bacteroidetes bacterium]|nr:ribosome small subunit-dependent GTPase A [Bacteroidota bacterium]